MTIIIMINLQIKNMFGLSQYVWDVAYNSDIKTLQY